MFQITDLSLLILCWIAWSLAFVRARANSPREVKVARAPKSYLGIALQSFSFILMTAYVRPEQFQKSELSLIASALLGPLSVALAWWATRHLGKHWRFEAALSEDHELVQTGPYRWLRHPIYASMLGMLLAIAAAWTWWPIAAVALAFFLAGTEIRVRAEDRLLIERFNESFVDYRSRVAAYVPFIR
jgi:protein-S-isoprenylcysteine O-methyltransferase Ste14